jgi:hypothetical protein
MAALTRNDIRFLASVSRGDDIHHRLADLTALATEVDDLAAARDLTVELPALEALSADDADPDDPEAIDRAREEMRDIIGAITRGEYDTGEEATSGT